MLKIGIKPLNLNYRAHPLFILEIRMSVNDILATTLADSLNKKFKDTKVAYFLDGSDTTPTDIKDFISTLSSILDVAI